MKDADQEIDSLWQRINLAQAQTEAVATVLQAMLPLVQDSPAFPTALRQVLNEQIANRLCRGVDEKSTDEYMAYLNLILPPHLRNIVNP